MVVLFTLAKASITEKRNVEIRRHSSNVSMPWVHLGSSGFKLSRLILGCLTYGSPKYQSWILLEEEGIAQIKLVYDLGVHAFDTSNAHRNRKSEEMLRKAIRRHNIPREDIAVLTKAFFLVGRDNSDLINETPEGLNDSQREPQACRR
ncbi:hypothetical protein FS837_000175 [Tulasnella sp. UAMH 9824]|nr:hypothetical protein FS837_000175 [Tulasnella sp. UAMH 9824]